MQLGGAVKPGKVPEIPAPPSFLRLPSPEARIAFSAALHSKKVQKGPKTSRNSFICTTLRHNPFVFNGL